MKRRALPFVLGLLLAGAAAAQDKQNTANGFSADKAYQLNDVDQINTFNGVLNVNVPLGARYSASSALSYQFVLSYGGGTWTAIPEQTTWTDSDDETKDITVNWFSPKQYGSPDEPYSLNAGFGWQLSLGRIVGNYYISADGAQHLLHADGYTHDSTYLRTRLDGTDRLVEFPDGTVHRFDSGGRLVEMADRFSNKVSVTYPPVPAACASDPKECTQDWKLTEFNGGREHTVDMIRLTGTAGEAYSYDVVKRLILATPEGPATYTFNYLGGDALTGMSRKVAHHQDCRKGPIVLVPLLESITMPDGSKFSFVTDRGHATFDGTQWTGWFSSATGSGSWHPNQEECTSPIQVHTSRSGTLTSLTRPTGGKTTWEYQNYAFPPRVAGGAPCPQVGGCSFGASSRSNDGVSTRIDRNRDGTFVSKKTYDHMMSLETSTSSTTVSVYDSDANGAEPVTKTVSYYHTPQTNADQIIVNGVEPTWYGLPFTMDPSLAPASQTNPSSGRYLSTKTLDRSGNLLAYTYLEYESDSTTFDGATQNRRVKSQRSVELGAGGAIRNDVVTSSTGFDGVGHYRETTVTSSDSDLVRTTKTNYNPGGIPSSTQNWVINTYDKIEVEEHRTSNPAAVSRQTSRYCFDPATGFLLWKRTERGGEPGNDLLAVFTDEPEGSSDKDGNVSQEAYYGGDQTAIPDSFTGQCTGSSLNLGATKYKLLHEYQHGLRSSTKYAGMNFKTLDLTVHASGFPTESRDTAGLLTTMKYDTSGRVKVLDPPGIAATTYTYTPASGGSTAARVEVSQCSTQGSGCIKSKHYYDDFGRLIQSRRLMPSSAGAERWAAEWITYDKLGRKATQSLAADTSSGEPGAMPSGLGKTTWTYDVLGRVSGIAAPDGATTSYERDGPRLVTRKSLVRTGSTSETISTQETYDHLGRLTSVIEDVGGLHLITSYAYDLGDRLIDVHGPRTAGETVPHRTFSYDGAGLLTAENHPESGFTTYPAYDARGHLLAKRRPPSPDEQPFEPSRCIYDLDYTYDAAERLTHVKGARYDSQDCSTFMPRPVKQFVYESSATTGDPALGRLRKAIRHNPNEVGDVIVTETYTYGDAGLVTKKETSAVNRFTTLQTFKQEFQYDDLGGQTRHRYPTCWTTGCGAATLDGERTAYANGAAISTSAFRITDPADPEKDALTPLATYEYHANGMRSKIVHANGVTDTIEADNGQARPKTITFSGLGDACTAPAVSVTPGSKNVTAGASETLQATVTPSGGSITYQWFRNGIEITGATSSSHPTGALNQTTTYYVTIHTPCGTATSPTATFTVGVPVPLNLSATRSGATGVLVSWQASTGAATYTVERRSGTSTFQQLVTGVASTSYLDGGCATETACAYRVRAVTSGHAASDPSNLDIATMVDFTNIVSGSTVVSLAHLEQVRSAVNAVRGATGMLSAQSWTTMLPPAVPIPAVGGIVSRTHITALREALDQALEVFELPLAPYTDLLDRPTMIKAIHLQQLKERTQ